jgi:sphingosine kinase
MSLSLLDASEGLYLSENGSRRGIPVEFSVSDGRVLFSFSRPMRLPMFGPCGPMEQIDIIIDSNDLLGLEKCEDRVRVRYASSSNGVRRLESTPWLYGPAVEGVSGHIESVCRHPRKRMLIIINPKSGKGNSERLVKEQCLPILEAAGATVELLVTEAPKHATGIIQTKSNLCEFDVVLSAGGDGTFHEIVAGLFRREDWRDCVKRLSLVQIPCGSGNALAASLGHKSVSSASYAAVRGKTSAIDVATIIQPSTGTIMFSFLSVTFGLIANLDIGTEHLRWMGAQRFVYGAVREIISQRVSRAGVSFVVDRRLPRGSRGEEGGDDDGPDYSGSGKYPRLRILGSLMKDDKSVRSDDGQFSMDESWEQLDGEFQLFSMANLPWLDTNFNLHPHSSSGSFNFVYCVGKQGIPKSVQLMTGAEKGQHMHLVEERQIVAFRVDPIAADTWLVIDGEAIDRSTIYGEVHPNLLRVLV